MNEENRIRAFRLAHGLTQQKICDIIGMPKRTLEEWEGGQRKTSEWIENLILYKLEREVK